MLKKNAQQLLAEVVTIEGDLLQPLLGKYDLIISNPPYIAENERPLMDRSVLEHEPAMALFAAENGLKIYRRLAKQLAAKLTDNGRLYVEIGFQQAAAVKKIFHQQLPTAKITVKKDITGKDRMIRVCLKSDK